MSVLLYFDALSSPLGPAERNLVAVGQRLATDGELAAVLGTAPAADVLAELGSLGVPAVFTDQEELSDQLARGQADLLVGAVRAATAQAVLAPVTPAETEVLARAAAVTESGIITGADAVEADLTASKPVLAGAARSVVRAGTPTVMITLRPGAAEPEVTGGEPALVLHPESAARRGATITARTVHEQGNRPDLGDARTVVAGGRGTDGDFSAVQDLADALDAAVGASRVATDSGWVEHDLQVGQTGRIVSPELYIAAGISGAVQHVAGMRTAGTIVAVNTDEDAPLLEMADLGIVGRLQDVLPQAADEIRRRRQGA